MRLFLLFLACSSLGVAADLPVKGIAHVRLKVSDLAKSRAFYSSALGLEPAFVQQGVLSLKVNDSQFIELASVLNDPGEDRLDHVALESTDLYTIRTELSRRGIPLTPQQTTPEGNRAFLLRDPDRHRVEFLQYMPGSLQSSDRGKHVPPTRIADRILYAGLAAEDRDRALAFWTGRAGLKEVRRGGPKNQPIRWINVGPLQLMLYDAQPSPEELGALHHIALQTVPGKPAAELKDPDGTRIVLIPPTELP